MSESELLEELKHASHHGYNAWKACIHNMQGRLDTLRATQLRYDEMLHDEYYSEDFDKLAAAAETVAQEISSITEILKKASYNE